MHYENWMFCDQREYTTIKTNSNRILFPLHRSGFFYLSFFIFIFCLKFIFRTTDVGSIQIIWRLTNFFFGQDVSAVENIIIVFIATPRRRFDDINQNFKTVISSYDCRRRVGTRDTLENWERKVSPSVSASVSVRTRRKYTLYIIYSANRNILVKSVIAFRFRLINYYKIYVRRDSPEFTILVL